MSKANQAQFDAAVIDPATIAQGRDEYYALIEADPSLQAILNENGGLMLARVGNHPPWPARFAEVGEFVKMLRFRMKKARFCVYFFGTRNYGWVHQTAIMSFSDDYTAIKASRKYSPIMVSRAIKAVADAKAYLADIDESARRFYDHILETKDDAVDMPCEVCNRVDDHFSPLILCDGNGCRRNFHMNCLQPPLKAIPPGDWFCPRCIKEPLRQTKGKEAAAAIEALETAARARLEIDTGGGKKMKREKTKGKEGALKRKLPYAREKASREQDESPANFKKPKSHRLHGDSSADSSPVKLPSTASTPVHGTGRKHQVAKQKPELESEERCLICGYGGKLVVCEFYKCTKVFHEFCLGSFPFPKDKHITWYCPHHTCAISGEKEVVVKGDATFAKSPRRRIVKNELWKCVHCPTAISDDAFPSHLPRNQILSKGHKSFLCPYCAHGAPLKVQLARHLERIWSLLATNHEGHPFCGPLLCGVTTPNGNELGTLDLFKILARIRRLEYDSAEAFLLDIETVVADALAIIGDRSKPLSEAAKSLRLFCSEQMNIHGDAIASIESKIMTLKASCKDKQALEETLIGSMDANGHWPVRWRQECGAFEDCYYPTIEARSLDEWTAYVTSASLYVNCEILDKSRTPKGLTPKQTFADSDYAASDADETMETYQDTGHAGSMQTFGGLSLSEGTDVIMALTELSQRGGGTEKTKLGAWEERELDEVNGHDFFLSPSISEMQQMFDQQSALLRRALESHSALQRAWLISKQKLLGLGDGVGFSVGEGRLAAELRLANKNLRARLDNKDKLVSQLTTDHAKLHSEVIALQKELAALKNQDGVVSGARDDAVMTPPPRNEDTDPRGEEGETGAANAFNTSSTDREVARVASKTETEQKETTPTSSGKIVVMHSDPESDEDNIGAANVVNASSASCKVPQDARQTERSDPNQQRQDCSEAHG